MAELFTSLPRQIYCAVERRFIGDTHGAPPLEPCSWFGLTSIPGRAWGLTVLLDSGAVYSQVPPHAICFPRDPETPPLTWGLEDAQVWDCFGVEFAVHEYDQLAGRRVIARIGGADRNGRYLFTAQHYGDGYAQTPEQAKQFHFLELDNGRLATLPSNLVLFEDFAFTAPIETMHWPTWIKRQTEIYRCE